MRLKFGKLGSRGRVFAKNSFSRLAGFALSVLVLAVTSIVTIPAMIFASADSGWGSIAVGQGIGNVAGLVVGYGWGWFGPGRIARGSASDRRGEYVDSVSARLHLALPLSILAAGFAYGISPSHPLFAAMGALQTTSIGLTATWYFIGLSRPYLLLALDTVPRSAGALFGAVLIYCCGTSAITVPIGGLIGMLVGFLLSTIWILRNATSNGAEARPARPVRVVLHANRYGVTSTFGMACFSAAPLVIVSATAPAIQPAFALADKVRIQLLAASSPAISVLQGWVPRASGASRLRRADVALVAGLLSAIALGVGTAASAPALIAIISNNQISLPFHGVVLMAVWISLSFFQSILERTGLATFGALGAASAAIVIGAGIGLVVVYSGAIHGSLAGALSGVVFGTAVILSIEFVKYLSIRSKGALHE
jgi:hypothetical protein